MREKREAREFDLENPIIKIEHLKKGFGTKEVLKDVNLIFPKGLLPEFWGFLEVESYKLNTIGGL